MTNIALRVENLSKMYRLGLRERYRTLGQALAVRYPQSGCAPGLAVAQTAVE